MAGSTAGEQSPVPAPGCIRSPLRAAAKGAGQRTHFLQVRFVPPVHHRPSELRGRPALGLNEDGVDGGVDVLPSIVVPRSAPAAQVDGWVGGGWGQLGGLRGGRSARRGSRPVPWCTRVSPKTSSSTLNCSNYHQAPASAHVCDGEEAAVADDEDASAGVSSRQLLQNRLRPGLQAL